MMLINFIVAKVLKIISACKKFMRVNLFGSLKLSNFTTF